MAAERPPMDHLPMSASACRPVARLPVLSGLLPERGLCGDEGQGGADAAEALVRADQGARAASISARVWATKFNHVRIGSGNGSPPSKIARAGSRT
jgi:hypothetical protein